jgi:hypothetical protein
MEEMSWRPCWGWGTVHCGVPRTSSMFVKSVEDLKEIWRRNHCDFVTEQKRGAQGDIRMTEA